MRGIEQNEFCDFNRRLRGVDFFRVAGFYEKRKPPAVVEMCVREHDRVELFGSDSCGNAVGGNVRRKSLKNSAIYENLRLFRLNEEAGAGHAAGGTVGYYSHGANFTIFARERKELFPVPAGTRAGCFCVAFFGQNGEPCGDAEVSDSLPLECVSAGFPLRRFCGGGFVDVDAAFAFPRLDVAAFLREF